jgi:hypothetical protein
LLLTIKFNSSNPSKRYLIRKILQVIPIFSIIRRILTQTNPA